MRRLYYHAESDSYLLREPADLIDGVAALCVDVTGNRDHEREAWRRGAQMVVCPYCHAEAVLVDSAEVYSRSYGNIWLCRPCHAWVGVHTNDGLNRPLGRLADTELREWKQRAHAAFDPLWKGKMRRDGCSKGQARAAGYTWLATQLRIPVPECHVGMFGVATCRRVVEICTSLSGRREEAAR